MKKKEIDNAIKLKGGQLKDREVLTFQRELFTSRMCANEGDRRKRNENFKFIFFSPEKANNGNGKEFKFTRYATTPRNTPGIFQRKIALLLFPQRAHFTILLTFIDLTHPICFLCLPFSLRVHIHTSIQNLSRSFYSLSFFLSLSLCPLICLSVCVCVFSFFISSLPIHFFWQFAVLVDQQISHVHNTHIH